MSTTALIRLPVALLREMETAAVAAWPLEACGLILGRRQPGPAGEEIDALLFRPVTNAANEPRHGYLVPPLELLAIDRDSRELGLEIAGIWHSHPDAPAWPSRRDTEEAWEGYAYGIHAVTTTGAGELRFFALQDGAFRPISFSLAGEPPGDDT